ncbi:Secreted subtilisin-like serine protease sub4 [Actinomortierella wolfii]|nr:Secreted subtilisin-like serine protease sub4 [Actinomortierella wolfii]
MKVSYLLPIFLAAPLVHAGEYLVRFHEGPQTTTESRPVTRIQQFISVQNGAKGHKRTQFDYSSNELKLTLLSISQAISTAGGSPDNANVGVASLGSTTTVGEGSDQIEIRSMGRWFTFDDSHLHVWHGNFSDEEAALLAKDGGVDIIERDVEIRFAELEGARSKATVEHLEQVYKHLDQEMQAAAALERRKTKEEDKKLTNSGYYDDDDDGDDDDDDDDEKDSHHKKEKKPPKKTIPKPSTDHSHLEPSEINVKDILGPGGAYMIQRKAPSWGLPRVSQRKLPLKADYYYPIQAGEGVDVYVIDTGINIHHVDFQGRARWGTNTVPGAPNTDDNGHGTFVAGVIGSHTFGVAKKVSLIAVKGLNEEGTSTLSQILSALDWTIKATARSPNRRNIVNLSLGAGYSRVLNTAVDALVRSGLFVVVAAGNGDAKNVGQDACNYSPASATTSFTVGSTNINDQMSSFSNYGRCVNIYAPGERVRSTWIGPTNREIYTDSGTSFSAPNVAGIAALIMSAERGDRGDGLWSPRSLGNRIIQLGTRGVVRNFKGPSNTNLLAFNGVGIIGANNDPKDGDNNAHNGNNGTGTGNTSNGGSGSPGVPSGSGVATPRSVSGSPIRGSAANQVATVPALQAFTILSTIMMVVVSFVWSM